VLTEVFEIEANYFERNQERMRYPKFRKQWFFHRFRGDRSWQKTIIGRRKQSGMFGAIRGANAIIAFNVASPGWHYVDFGCIHRYDLPAPRRNAFSPPKFWPVSRGQMGELPLWDDSSFHRFARAIAAAASMAGLRGES
jgi:hypothetical protein